MKKYTLVIFLSLALFGCDQTSEVKDQTQLDGSGDLLALDKSEISESDKILETAFQDKQSNIQVQGVGTVARLLADDNVGSRHQRFILSLATEQTLLVAHNIDLATRIDSLQNDDVVEFFGVYEWNSKGGVIHWTHHDPKGIHVNGWLKHENITYE